MTDSRLHAWLQQQLATGLPAIAGTRVTASVPLQVDLVNELIAEALADAVGGVAETPAAGPPSMDVKALLRHVRTVRVDAAPGVITLDVALAIGE